MNSKRYLLIKAFFILSISMFNGCKKESNDSNPSDSSSASESISSAISGAYSSSTTGGSLAYLDKKKIYLIF
jgi:hypothetical protein